MTDLVIHLDPSVVQYAADIRRFVDAMAYKLKVHAKKGRWEEMTAQQALDLLALEYKELADAIDDGNTVEVMLEAADIANFAMIITSIFMERSNG